MFHSVIVVFALFCLVFASASRYNYKFGNASLWHSEVTYCDPAHYLSRNYVGYTSSFVPVAKIEDASKSTYGYIGYQPNIETIFVTFRGSEDIQNWVTNLEATLTSYPLCSGCQVHKGFYEAEQAVFPNILAQVKSLKSKYPNYSVIATGHSLGAALASLTAFDLVSNGVSGVQLYDYGSPRVGNTAFADWASKGSVPVTRCTHYKDMVPHTPMHERFTHMAGEIYEDLKSGGPLYDCSGEEDPKCSYQWSITSIEDHLLYQGLTMGSGGCAAVGGN